jgi:DNA-binding transcriptional LysR family regulator
VRRGKLDLNVLETYATVCLSGSLKSAAEHLHLTQSAVSMQIKRLEECVQQRLLERSNQNFRVTPAGERMLAHARALLRLENAAVHEFLNDPIAGEVRIGVPTDYAPALLSSALPNLHGCFPAIVPLVECDLSRKLRRKLENNELDLAILTQDVDIDTGMPLWEERLVWVEPAPDERVSDSYTPIGLLDVDCVMRDLTLRLAAQHAPLHRIAFRSTNLSSIVSAVESGFCASLIPQDSLNMTTATANRLKVLPVSDQLRIRLAISRADKVGIKAIAEFLQTQLLLSVRRGAAQVSHDRLPEALEHGR